MTVPVRPKNVGVWGAAVSAVLHLLVFGPVTPCHGVEQPSDDADDAGTQTVIDSSRRFGLNPGTEKSGGSTLASLENDVQKPPPHKTDDREVSCHRYVVSGAGDIRANGQYAVVTNSVDHNGGAVPTPGLYKRCSTAAEAGTPHDCDKYFELYSLPAWPAAGTWRIRGWNKKVEYVAANETAAGAAPPQHWLSPDASSGPAPVSVACNRTDDDSYLPPKLVVVGQAEMIWNQTADACPGSCGCPACGNPAPCSWENPGESPDSMPIAFHDELRNESRLISATPWGTYAHVGTTLHDLPLRHDCSHSLFNEFNSTDPAKFADHQWMQSVRLMPDGSGSALIHSEMHGDLSGNWSLCSIQRETNHTVAPRGECQYWSSGLGKTTDGGASWRLAEPPPAHMVFSPDRKYEKDSPNLGFGAIGGMLELDGFVYGHVNEIAAGAAGPHPHGWAASSGVCAFRVPADSVGDPKAFRGWTGTGWNKQFKDPYIATATQVCKPIVAGFEGNAHPQLRRLTGKALIERQRKDGWPTHLMLGWPENVKGTEFAYAYPKNWRGNNQSAEEAPFTEWTEAVTVDVGPWIDPSSHLFPIMYPSILDADSPFSLSAMPGASKADGLSYALVGNESAYIYIVARRAYLGRIPVAFVPWWQQPLPAPFPPPPPSALNPAGCKAFDVVGAGDAACNGKYVATSNISYTKDATHQLYFFGGHWKMAHEGVGPVYYTAHDIRGGVKRVPVTSWQGTPPSPNVTCIDRPLKNDDSCAFAPHDWVAVRTLKSVSASSRAECCAKCIATPSCEAGTLDTAGQCYLKAVLQSTTSCSNCTSCTLPGKDVASILFGPSSRFTMRLNPATLGLQNISVSSHDGAFTQGFLANEMALPRRTEYALWRLNITDCKTTLPEGTMVTPCIGNDCGNTSHTVSPNGSTLTLRWAGVPLSAKFKGVRLDVTVTVAQLPGSKPGVSLRGAVSLSASSASSDGQVCLQNMALPTLDGIQMRSETTDTMFIPDFFGHTGKCSAGSCKMDMKLNWDGMIDQVSGTKEYNYMPNGNDRAMQWFSFYSNYTSRSLGLYVGAHDPDSHLQLAMATGAWPTRTYAGGAALHWYHIPDNPLAPLNGPESAWEMAYEVVLQGFEGDWYDGAQIYREWVLQNARWTRRGDVATRLANKEFPEYLTTTPFLIESDVGRPSAGTYGHGADKNDTIANMVRIMKLLGVKEMINWWSSWNSEFYDNSYPQFTPRKGFQQRVKQMRDAGIHVVPYTNGRLFDPKIKMWNSTNASAHMCFGDQGPYREIYHRTGPSANISFYIADPADDYWQNLFVSIAKELRQAGVDGLYIDQLASYYPQPCFSRAGGDSAGTGWADGGRKLFSAVAEALGPDTAVFSESNAEAYIGDLHGNMALYGWERCGFVPAFQAVYQGWTVNAGLLEWPIPTNKSDPTLKTGWVQGTNLASWMAYSALQLVYGHIPGAMMTQDLLFVLENSAEALALWRDMMRVRADARDFLVFGQMLRPPAATVPLQSIRLCGNKPVKAYPCCPVPEVVASVFKAKNGSVALIAANIANVTVAYEAIVDLGGGKHANVSVLMLPTSARVVLLPALRHLQQRK